MKPQDAAARERPIDAGYRGDRPEPLEHALAAIRDCRLCAERFAAAKTAHAPRPIVQMAASARICLVGQAPGLRAHAAGRPFDDPSGVRLRRWLGLDEPTFYDPARIAIAPMGFCFPGYDARGADLPPPALCADTWRARLFAAAPRFELVLLIGGLAQAWHLGGETRRRPMAETVGAWAAQLAGPPPRRIALPHPSWRNNAWLKRHPWFEEEVAPAIRDAVAEIVRQA